MERLPRLRKVFCFPLFITLPLILAGCARVPAGKTQTTVREISFAINFNGPINDSYYYFVPIDITGAGPGPVPIFPTDLNGAGWVTGSATHFVQYHAGQYQVFRITNLQPLTYEPLGSPLRFVTPFPGSKTLVFTLDLNSIGATGDTIDVNFIAVDQPLSSTRLIDGLGPLGTDFLNVNIQSNRTIGNNDTLVPEGPNDVLNQNRAVQPENSLTSPLDIIDWSITTNI